MEPFSAAEDHVALPSLPAATDVLVDRSHSSHPDTASGAVTVNAVARPYGMVEEAISSMLALVVAVIADKTAAGATSVKVPSGAGLPSMITSSYGVT